jgi:sulfur-oxidizing protein SoxY
MPARRQVLRRTAAIAGLLGCTGLFPQLAWAVGNNAFDAKTVQDALAALSPLSTGALAESADVSLSGPDRAEHGAIVPFSFGTSLPGVKQMLLLAEKNPVPLIAVFDILASLEPAFSIRAKLAQSTDVFAVAILHDGRALYARKAVGVTVGSCD